MSWCDRLGQLRVGLDEGRVRCLEAFRRQIDCPHDLFALRIAGSKWATREALRQSWDIIRSSNPQATDREIVTRLYEQRRTMLAMTGHDYAPLPPDCGSLRELTDFACSVESRWALPDPFGWGQRIDDLLEDQLMIETYLLTVVFKTGEVKQSVIGDKYGLYAALGGFSGAKDNPHVAGVAVHKRIGAVVQAPPLEMWIASGFQHIWDAATR